MDTLCVPVDPQSKEHRKKAIHLMANTFHEATTVLVLDKELLMIHASTSSFVELGIRIFCSGWMKRLWTLQEMTFALKPMAADLYINK